MDKVLNADYLIIGAGAAGMAFADSLVSETDATIAIVDRHHRPGGHWNNAYSFVRLHGPSAFYGVNSHALGSGMKYKTGLNKGCASPPSVVH
jgi:cation diffusion facilitator CzcD-associated flavoprotein CzcO